MLGGRQIAKPNMHIRCLQNGVMEWPNRCWCGQNCALALWWTTSKGLSHALVAWIWKIVKINILSNYNATMKFEECPLMMCPPCKMSLGRSTTSIYLWVLCWRACAWLILSPLLFNMFFFSPNGFYPHWTQGLFGLLFRVIQIFSYYHLFWITIIQLKMLHGTKEFLQKIIRFWIFDKKFRW